MPRISEMPDAVFDGVDLPYVPPKTLRLSKKLKLTHSLNTILLSVI